MDTSPEGWRHSKNCWQTKYATSPSDIHCDCGLTAFINLIYSKDKLPAVEGIPVCMIGAWGAPVPVGLANIRGTKDVHIHFEDDELVEEFYDLSQQELIVSVSFRYKLDSRTPVLR